MCLLVSNSTTVSQQVNCSTETLILIKIRQIYATSGGKLVVTHTKSYLGVKKCNTLCSDF
jgi:hypothetical protein